MSRIVTSRPSLGTQSHLSSGWGMDDDRGVRDKESLDAGSGWCRARATTVRVPAWHEAVHLRTFQVGCGACDGGVVRTGAEAALSTLRTGAAVVAGEDFPASIAGAGVGGGGACVWVRSSQGVKGVFVG